MRAPAGRGLARWHAPPPPSAQVGCRWRSVRDDARLAAAVGTKWCQDAGQHLLSSSTPCAAGGGTAQPPSALPSHLAEQRRLAAVQIVAAQPIWREPKLLHRRQHGAQNVLGRGSIMGGQGEAGAEGSWAGLAVAASDARGQTHQTFPPFSAPASSPCLGQVVQAADQQAAQRPKRVPASQASTTVHVRPCRPDKLRPSRCQSEACSSGQ